MDFDDRPKMFSYREAGAQPNTPSLVVRFEEAKERNEEWTASRGVATYDNVLIAYITIPGAPKSEAAAEIERVLPDGTVKLHPVNSRKYADQTKAYKSGGEAEALGTPLRDLPGMTPAMIANFRAQGIHTIEMLATAADSGAELMGFRENREKAQRMVALREKEAPMKKVEAELVSRDRKIAALEAQLADLIARFGEPEPRKKPGPKPKLREAA